MHDMRLELAGSLVLSLDVETIVLKLIIEFDNTSVVLVRKLSIVVSGESEWDLGFRLGVIVGSARLWIGIDPAVVRSFQSALELVRDTAPEDAFIAEFVYVPIVIES